jgi:hypothetical protein
MKVKDLIRWLQQFEPEAEVFTDKDFDDENAEECVKGCFAYYPGERDGLPSLCINN